MRRAHFDLAIIGAGITGLSSAWHSTAKGLKVVVVGDYSSTSLQSASLLSGGLSDNFTRIATAHGSNLAARLWQFGDRGFDGVVAFAKEHRVPYQPNRRLRLIVNEHELREAEQAVKLMRAAKLFAALVDKDASPLASVLSERSLQVQDDGPRGAWIAVDGLLAALRARSPATYIDHRLVNFSKEASGPLLCTTDKGTEFSCEMLLLACHDHIAQFVPQLATAAITYADQWSAMSLTSSCTEHIGIVWSAFHGYEWGGFCPEYLVAGGNRFLRPLAGVGAKRAEHSAKIEEFTREQLAKSFSFTGKTIRTTALLDIWPCDELPLIGPMYGEERILVACGYMNNGLALGFAAGEYLANLITSTSPDNALRELWPERLRSL